MKFTRFRLLLCAVLLLPLVAEAGDEGRTYVIQKGDTLWGLSQKFLKDPYYWPNLWANNPEIRNPHFIYPGQTVRIYDGRIEIVPAEPTPPPTPAEAPVEPAPVAADEQAPPPVATTEVAPPPPPPAVEKAVTIRTTGGEGFIATEDLAGVGRLVDATDNRLLLGAGDKAFLQLTQPAQVGDRFELFDVSQTQILHPLTGKPAGYRVIELGMVEVLSNDGDVATGLIRQSFREVQRGARLRPYQEPVRTIALKKARRPVSGVLLDAYSGKIQQAQNDVIFIDRGAADGLEVGNLLYVSRPRKLTEQVAVKTSLQLPDELLGMAVLIETRAQTATALIIKSVAPMVRGDRITTAD